MRRSILSLPPFRPAVTMAIIVDVRRGQQLRLPRRRIRTTLTQRSLPFIPEFNSNSGLTFGDVSGSTWAAVMQSLSHFSHHKTGGRYVLCDLQGSLLTRRRKGETKVTGVVLTDPVILSRNREYGVTELGAAGISTFFARHQCNQFCKHHWHVPRDARPYYFNASAGTTMMGFNQRGSL